jgi:hypothetical protein
MTYRYQMDLPDRTHYLDSEYQIHAGDVIQLEEGSEWIVTRVLLFSWRGEIRVDGSAPLLSVSRVPSPPERER